MASLSACSHNPDPVGCQEGFLDKSCSAAPAPKLGNFDRLYNPFRIMSGHDPGPVDDVPRLGNMKRRYTKHPTAHIREVRQRVAARIKQVERKGLVNHDSSSEDDAVAVGDDIFPPNHSLASTPATTPDVSPVSSKDDHHDVSDLETGPGKAAHAGYEHRVKTSPLPVSPLTPLASNHVLPPCTVRDELNHIRQTGNRGEILPFFSEMQRMKRAHLSKIVDTRRISSAADTIFLPWDAQGVYRPGLGPLVSLDSLLPNGQPHQFGPGLDFISQTAIEPLYRLDRITQLKIIRVILDKTFDEDDLLRKHSFTSTKATQPVHVFIDASNIIIGFYGRIKQARYIPIESRIRTPSFFFEGFATAIERGRPCAKRIFAGSMKAGSSTPDYMREAASLGYEMNILQRVKGSKKTRSQYDMNLPGVYIPESHDNTHREQAVDEILQLKMMHTLIDTSQPGTMVVATGDAAEAEFSDGFHKCVLRALQHGWLVEVVGFRENMSSAWFAADFQKHWALQFRVFTLDCMVEELLTPYYS